MDTSKTYTEMCKRAIELQGYINESHSKDVYGVLQTRGVHKGDFLLFGHQYFSKYSEHVGIAHIDYNIFRDDEEELLYMIGKEQYSYTVPFLGHSHTRTLELNFPCWRDVHVNDDDIYKHIYYYLTSGSNDFVWWMPRQDQIQDLYWNGLTNQAKARAFIDWLDTATYNAFTYSLEMLWLMFYMKAAHNKVWDGYGDNFNWVIR